MNIRDSSYNQFPTKVHVASTLQTEPMIIGETFYPKYPKIRKEDIGRSTSNLFVDSLNLSNLYLDGIGGDYDGDQVSVKGIYSREANEELEAFMNSKAHFINLGANAIRKSDKEAIQCLYNLTLILPADKARISKPIF